jgi:uncharacterized phage-associated protein
MDSTPGTAMANVYDAAEYILAKQGEIPAVKLHKLLYYSQAWSLVWNESPLFSQQIQAWKNGPVVSDLYRCHRQQFTVAPTQFAVWASREGLTEKQTATIDAVLAFYGDKGTQWLSDLTHMEDPWRLARAGIADGESSTAEITQASMAEYYGGLAAKK